MSFLIIKGASTTDDLSYYGVALASRYAAANTVILIDKDNKVNFVKGNNHPLERMDFMELEDSLNEFSLIIQKIFDAHRIAHPESFDLSRSFVANWLFTWTFGTNKVTYEVMKTNEMDFLRESADDFIERDFGMSREAILNNDGTTRTH